MKQVSVCQLNGKEKSAGKLYSFAAMKYAPTIFFLLMVFSCSCTHGKYGKTNRVYKKQAKAFSKVIKQTPGDDAYTRSAGWVGTTNFGMRKPNFVIIHHTAQNSCDQTLQTFTLPRTQVSAHYVICKDGGIFHMLNDYLRAWHAGLGSWGNDKDINSSSIGIELDNNGFEAFNEPQLTSLLTLLDTLKQRYKIPAANFIGHSDIAPLRKQDPNVYFPWQRLAGEGFGLWYGDTTYVQVPEPFNVLQGLRIIGYDIKDSMAAIKAFKRHFLLQDSSTIIFPDEKKIVYDLMLQYQ